MKQTAVSRKPVLRRAGKNAHQRRGRAKTPAKSESLPVIQLPKAGSRTQPVSASSPKARSNPGEGRIAREQGRTAWPPWSGCALIPGSHDFDPSGGGGEFVEELMPATVVAGVFAGYTLKSARPSCRRGT